MNATTSQLECLLIADDLTGACDAAVHFAASGRATAACLDLDADLTGLDVAGHQHRHPRRARRRVPANGRGGRAPIRGLPDPRAVQEDRFHAAREGRRGNPDGRRSIRLRGRRRDARVSGHGPHRARLATCESPLPRISSRFICLLTFCAQGVACAHAGPGGVREALAAGARYVSVDAASDDDLDAVVREVLAAGRKTLWAGSGGLAAALARAGCAAVPAPIRPPRARRRRAVLHRLGPRRHPGAAAVSGGRSAAPRCVGAGTATPDSVRDALARGEHVVLRIPRGPVSAAKLRDLVGELACPALLLSGGDTASAVCRALGVRRIELRGEIVPGTPVGRAPRWPARWHARRHQVRRLRRPWRIDGRGRLFHRATPPRLTPLLGCC